MRFFYSLLIRLTSGLLPVVALFSKKIRYFLKSRKEALALNQQASPSQKGTFWMHVASLGEYEQGLPLLEKWGKSHPKQERVVSFFSPSGYEIKKNKAEAEFVTYLPLDTPIGARTFIDKWNPKIAIFVKYEIWPNTLLELKRRGIPVFLLSARFHPEQIYFRPYGGWMRKQLSYIHTFFVQNQISAELLQKHIDRPVLITGDSRFDRVENTRLAASPLPLIKHFKGEKKLFVVGSSWPEDEEVLLPSINNEELAYRWVIAPHQLNEIKIQHLAQQIKKPILRFSSLSIAEHKKGALTAEDLIKLQQAEILVLDTIGLLSRTYQYATAAYVGGGFSTGLHNILEAVVFGIPVWIGPHFNKFPEAVDLVKLEAVFSICSATEFYDSLENLKQKDPAFSEVYRRGRKYCEEQLGATDQAFNVVQEFTKIT
jgi:3-deoxy-D-manno-octulosonic-acid transferase